MKRYVSSITGVELPYFKCTNSIHRWVCISDKEFKCYKCKATKTKVNMGATIFLEYRYGCELPVHPDFWGELYLLKKVNIKKVEGL